MRSLIAVTLVFWALSGLPARAEQSLADRLASLGAAECEDSDLTCLTLPMPLDRTANDPDRTIDITFAISLATEESKGILFYFVGGPGSGGAVYAAEYLEGYSDELIAEMDIVFMDQRGTGPVHGFGCPVADAKDELSDSSLDTPEELLADTKAWVEQCIAEIDKGDFLAHISTNDSVADIEAFRQAIGAPKVWLYGESYGTQFVQTYANQHPEAVAGAIIDGVQDLALSLEGYYTSASAATEALIGRMAEECRAHADCAKDVQGDPVEAFDRIFAALGEAPIMVDFVLADGTVAKRELYKDSLPDLAFNALYDERSRVDFVQAMVAASQEDYVPLLLFTYYDYGIDPQTEDHPDVEIDPTDSNAAYYAIYCSDYGPGPGTPDENARRILDQARAIAAERPRSLYLYYYDQLVCAYWPYRSEEAQPPAFTGGDYPTLVLNGDSDPITPITMAYSVLDNIKNGYGIFQIGGGHVIFGDGHGCPDSAVYAALLEGTLPPAREMQCKVDFLDGYVPLTLTSPNAAADPLAVAKAVVTELDKSPGWWFWDDWDPFTIGCTHGGTVTATATDRGYDYTLDACAFWPGLVVTGTGVWIDEDDVEDGWTLEIKVTGNHGGQLSYHHNTHDSVWHLTGQYDGKEVTTPRAYP